MQLPVCYNPNITKWPNIGTVFWATINIEYYTSIKIIPFQLFELNYGGSEGNFGNWFVMILAWHDEQSGDGLWVNIYKS